MRRIAADRQGYLQARAAPQTFAGPSHVRSRAAQALRRAADRIDGATAAP